MITNKVIKDMLKEDYLRLHNIGIWGRLNKTLLAFWSKWEQGWVIDPITFFRWYTDNCYNNYNVNYPLIHSFGFCDKSERGSSYLHTGIDRLGMKGADVCSPIDGNVTAIKYNPWHGHGNSIEIMTFYKDQEIVYKVCHLNKINKSIGMIGIIEMGQKIGTIGNSGFCHTFDDGKWRRVSKAEIENKKCQFGVHLHEMILCRGKK